MADLAAGSAVPQWAVAARQRRPVAANSHGHNLSKPNSLCELPEPALAYHHICHGAHRGQARTCDFHALRVARAALPDDNVLRLRPKQHVRCGFPNRVQLGHALALGQQIFVRAFEVPALHPPHVGQRHCRRAADACKNALAWLAQMSVCSAHSAAGRVRRLTAGARPMRLQGDCRVAVGRRRGCRCSTRENIACGPRPSRTPGLVYAVVWESHTQAQRRPPSTGMACTPTPGCARCSCTNALHCKHCKHCKRFIHSFIHS